MNKVKMLIDCLTSTIKKYFFKGRNDDINHACEKLQELNDEITSVEERKHIEEYALKYNTTTRWQTL